MPNGSLNALCAACGQSKRPLEVLGEVQPTQEGVFSVDTFRLVHCKDCDVVRLEPVPTSGDLRLMYEESIQFKDATYTDPERVASILGYYGNCLDNHRLTPGPGVASLEVGAGLAWVSRAIKQRQAAAVTWAQDVSSECVNDCAWVDHYRVGPLDSLDPQLRFHLISLTHVIEHLADPRSVVRMLARKLLPGGRLFITAPFRPTGWRRGTPFDAWLNYSYLHVPAHISYLSQRWFQLVARECGLRLLHWDASHEQGQAFEAVLGA